MCFRERDQRARVRDGSDDSAGLGGAVRWSAPGSRGDRGLSVGGLDHGSGGAATDRVAGGQPIPRRLALAVREEEDGSRGRARARPAIGGEPTPAGRGAVEGSARMAIADSVSPIVGGPPHGDQEYNPFHNLPRQSIVIPTGNIGMDERPAPRAGTSGRRRRRLGRLLGVPRTGGLVARTVDGGTAAASRGGLFDEFGRETIVGWPMSLGHGEDDDYTRRVAHVLWTWGRR